MSLRPRGSTRSGLWPLAVVMCGQALLLFCNLDLLPAWGDEVFTFRTVAHPIREIAAIVQRDIHPPLYYVLLHWWVKLPLPWTGLAAMRSFSAVAALACTVLLDCFWLRHWRPAHRWPALALFAFSPCLMLYGRMARSYTLQTALALAAVSLLWRWMSEPRRLLARAAPALAAVTLLLYTHYLPAATEKPTRMAAVRRLGPARAAAFYAAAAAAYWPWLLTLAGALRSWAKAGGFQSHYSLAANPAVEQAIKIAVACISWTIGESFAPVSLAMVPLALALIWRGCRARTLGQPLWPPLLLAALVGYGGANRWVTWPFIAARLLWLLPFLTIALAVGLSRCRRPLRIGATAVILLSSAASTLFYFRRENFVNLGYTSPVREIAARLTREPSPRDAILIDGYNTDFDALLFYGGVHLGQAILAETAPQVRAAAAAPAVWLVRNTRDVSPRHLVSSLESEICRGRTRSVAFYEPYPTLDRAAVALVTPGAAPRYFYQVTVCR